MGSIPQVSILKGASYCDSKKRRRLHQLFSEAANREPNATALIFEDEERGQRTLSYKQVDEDSWRYARGILARCNQPEPNSDGDKVAVVCLPPSDELIMVLLAVWKSGATYLPLEPSPPSQRVQHIVQESQPFLVVTSKEDAGLFSGVNVLTIEELKTLSHGKANTPFSTGDFSSGDMIEFILYTSGSTGLSKGVRVKNSSVVNRLEWQWREFPYTVEEQVCVFKTALTFVDSVAEMWAPLLCPTGGRSILIVPKKITSNPQHLVPLLDKYKIGRLVLVPTLLKSILTYLEFINRNPNALNSLKLWVCSGETLTVSLAGEFFQKFGENTKCLCNFYGSTEIMGDVTYHVMKNQQDVSIEGKVPIGIPLDNTVIYLLDKDMRIVNIGEIGELYVAGKHIAAGYVKGRDAFRFVQSPYTVDPEYKYLFKTGDYGRIYKSTLLYEGRTDSQIKVRGHRVDLSEAEVALNKIPEVEKGVVLCNKPGETDQEILGFVLLEANANINTAHIENILKRSLPSYAIPQIIMVDSIPLLVNGKVDRQYLLKYYRDQSNVEFNCADFVGIVPGKEDAAECLFKTVYSVLGRASRSKITPKANFYQIGGNSLNSVITIAQLKEAGYDISITDFINAKDFTEIIKKMSTGSSENGFHTGINKFTIDFISDQYKDDVYRIIGDSFCQKADIELTMDPQVNRCEYDALLDKLWPTLLKQRISIVLKNSENEVIGTSLFLDTADEPDVHLEGQLSYIFQFLEYLEVPVMETMVPKGKVLHSFMLGTDQKLSPQENIEITEFMEREIEGIARSRGFIGVFTTNTSPLTQQLAETILNYNKLKSYQVNQFVAPDGTRPFKRGPDDLLAVCSFKGL